MRTRSHEALLSYTISSIDVFIRDIGPPRMDFAIGKGKSLFPEWMRINVEVRLILASADGRQAFGCSADWPSFGWLDKRAGIEPKQKLRDLLQQVLLARDAFAQLGSFDNPFDAWSKSRAEFHSREEVKNGVPLCSSFCVALFERALIDAFCRIEQITFFEALKRDRLGFRPDVIHPELRGFDITSQLPSHPLDSISFRHTVGPSDPIVCDDIDENQRPNDGLPHTLEDYISIDGISSFKIKISGNADADLARLQRIWQVVQDCDPTITLDGNEAYGDIAEFQKLVVSLAVESPDLFRCIRFVEQPYNRTTTFDIQMRDSTKAIAERIPLIIDEADEHLHAFADAIELGYQGVSHKNCKGIFKSLANFSLCRFRNQRGANLIQSAEDLTCLPFVSLHQDLAVTSALGLSDSERNGHHFFFGLSHLSDIEKTYLSEQYGGLYRNVDGEWFLNIVDGNVDISSLNSIRGLGVAVEPEWANMTPLGTWLANFK